MAYSKIFANLNSTPSHFMREITPADARSLPPLIQIYHDPRPCPKSNPLFTTVSMASFSKENMEAFPTEILPGRGEKIQRQTNEFTNSFIAGAYRDNRMGIAELRQKRIEKIKAKQEKLAVVQKNLANDVKRIQKRSARRLLRDIERTRRLHDLHSIDSAIIIQRNVRRYSAQNRIYSMKQKIINDEKKRLKEIQEKKECDAASLIARSVLRYLAYKYSRLTRRMSSRRSSISPKHVSPSSAHYRRNSGSIDHNWQSRNPMSVDEVSQENVLHEWEDGASTPDSTKIAVNKDRANTFLTSLLQHQHGDEKLMTSLMMKILNESTSMKRNSDEKDELSESSEENELQEQERLILQIQEAASVRIQTTVRGSICRRVVKHLRLLRKTFRAWRSYRANAPSRTPSRSPSFSEDMPAFQRRSSTPSDVFSASILELLRQQKQEDLEDESATRIQCFFRLKNASKKTEIMRTFKRKQIKRERELTAKAILARIPQEQPDRSCPTAWLQEDSMKVVKRTNTVHGVVDLSKTSRNAFWLQSSVDINEHLRSGLKSQGLRTGGAAKLRASSVKGMLSAGLKPYFKK